MIPFQGPLNDWNVRIMFEEIEHEFWSIVHNCFQRHHEKLKTDHFSNVCIFVLAIIFKHATFKQLSGIAYFLLVC